MMILRTRKEQYLNEIVGNGNTAPGTPYTREELFFADILGEVNAPVPVTRIEIYLAKIANKYSGEMPEPKTRIEKFIARAAGMDVIIPTPITREEMLWANYALIVEKELSGIPPLTFKAKKAGTLKDYRIYGNTAGGESVGDLVAEGEHAGEYKVAVTVEGKNLFDKSKPANILKCYLAVSTLVSNVDTRTIFIECKPSTTYTVSKIQGERFVVGWSDKLPAPGVELQEKVINYNASSITITTGLAAKYLVAYIYNAGQDAPITVDEMIASVQIEKGSTATPYEPYRTPITTPIYLPEPIKMVGDEAEYIDFMEQKQHFADGTSVDVNLPALPTLSGTNTLTVGTEVQPSNVYIKYEGAR